MHIFRWLLGTPKTPDDSSSLPGWNGIVTYVALALGRLRRPESLRVLWETAVGMYTVPRRAG